VFDILSSKISVSLTQFQLIADPYTVQILIGITYDGIKKVMYEM